MSTYQERVKGIGYETLATPGDATADFLAGYGRAIYDAQDIAALADARIAELAAERDAARAEVAALRAAMPDAARLEAHARGAEVVMMLETDQSHPIYSAVRFMPEDFREWAAAIRALEAAPGAGGDALAGEAWRPAWPRDYESCPSCGGSFTWNRPAGPDSPCPFCRKMPGRVNALDAEAGERGA